MFKKDLTPIIGFFKSLNLSDSEIEYILERARGRDCEKIKRNSAFIKNYLNLTDTELKSFLLRGPSVLDYDITKDDNVLFKKFASLQSYFNISEERFKKLLKKAPYICTYNVLGDSPSSVKNKASHLKKLFSLSDLEARSMLLSYPEFVAYSNEVIDEKIKKLSNTLGISEDAAVHMLKLNPQLIFKVVNGEQPSTIESKLKRLNSIFNCNDELLPKIISKFSIILCCDIDKIEKRKQFCKQRLNLSDEEITHLIQYAPSILVFGSSSPSDDCKSLEDRISNLEQIAGEDAKMLITKCPLILNLPKEKIKIKYMMLKNLHYDMSKLYVHMCLNEKRLYARIKYLQSIGSNKYGYLVASEGMFKKMYGKSTKTLVENYPLDREAVKEIEEEYNKNQTQKLKLNQDELNALELLKE